jgi:hypothetical protein
MIAAIYARKSTDQNLPALLSRLAPGAEVR